MNDVRRHLTLALADIQAGQLLTATMRINQALKLLKASGWCKPEDDKPEQGQWVAAWYQGIERGTGKMVRVLYKSDSDLGITTCWWGNWAMAPDWWKSLGGLPPGVEG
jgi:hypothetical protein